MARSVNTIYQGILTEKEKYASLNGLTNTSTTAIWRTVFYCVAVVIATSEQLRDVFQKDMLDVAETLPTGTSKWYTARLLEYQTGYALSYNRSNGRVEYETIDENARLLEVATCQSEINAIVLKTAKSDGAGSLEALTPGELASVAAYVNDIKFAGTAVNLYSYPADLLKLTLNIKVNATVINADGTSVITPTEYPVEDAIDEFIKLYSVENFDSTFKFTELLTAIKNVNGVLNVAAVAVSARPSSATAEVDILATQLHTYTAVAGYLKIDPAFTLRDNITYIV